MAPSEIVISASSSEASGGGSIPVKTASAPAIVTHDLLTSTHLHSFKTSTSLAASTSYVPTQDHTGGAVFAVQEGKALLHVWAWQKDQMQLKIHLPEKMSCFAVSPNGCWAAAGSAAGQVYMWEIATGLLLTSFTAHYRAVSTLTFSADSHLLLSSSLDSSVHVYLVSRLLTPDEEGGSGLNSKPYGALSDHTLAVKDVQLGRTAGAHGGRCWTASEDGTIKVWSLSPPFDLLTTFQLPDSSLPTCLAVDTSERFFYAGTSTGAVHHFPLFRHREGSDRVMESIGGAGQGSASIKADLSVISHKSPISAIALSLSSTHLLVGTQSGEIHVHALPSHQLIRTIAAHNGSITHLSTMARPADFIGTPGVRTMSAANSASESWPIMEIRPFERQKASKQTREAREVVMLSGPKRGDVDELLDSLVSPASGRNAGGLAAGLASAIVSAGAGGVDTASQIADLESENKRLKASLDKAIKDNEKMWNGVVQMKLAENGQR